LWAKCSVARVTLEKPEACTRASSEVRRRARAQAMAGRRQRARSSASTASRGQWTLFSTLQCFLMSRATVWRLAVSAGDKETAACDVGTSVLFIANTAYQTGDLASVGQSEGGFLFAADLGSGCHCHRHAVFSIAEGDDVTEHLPMPLLPLNNNTIKAFKRPQRRFSHGTAASRGSSIIKVDRRPKALVACVARRVEDNPALPDEGSSSCLALRSLCPLAAKHSRRPSLREPRALRPRRRPGGAPQPRRTRLTFTVRAGRTGGRSG